MIGVNHIRDTLTMGHDLVVVFVFVYKQLVCF